MGPYKSLANAIVLRAVADYRMTDDRMKLEEIERFFRSDFFSFLTSIDGETLFKKLREEKAYEC